MNRLYSGQIRYTFTLRHATSREVLLTRAYECRTDLAAMKLWCSDEQLQELTNTEPYELTIVSEPQ